MDLGKMREMSDSELEDALKQAKQDLWSARFALSTRQLRIVAATFGERQGLVGCAAMINQWITSERAVDAAIAEREGDHSGPRSVRYLADSTMSG